MIASTQQPLWVVLHCVQYALTGFLTWAAPFITRTWDTKKYPNKGPSLGGELP